MRALDPFSYSFMKPCPHLLCLMLRASSCCFEKFTRICYVYHIEESTV